MTRFENLVAISTFLRDQYVSNMRINESIERFNLAGDIEKVNAILSSPTYKDSIQTRFTINEIGKRSGVNRGSVRYALLGAFEMDVRNGRQVAELQDHGIKIHYDWGVTRPRYSYDPNILAVANRVTFSPQQTQYVTTSIDPVAEIAQARLTSTGANPQPPHECPEPCPNEKHHDWVSRIEDYVTKNLVGEPEFKDLDWSGIVGNLLQGYVTRIVKPRREQTPEN